MAKLHITMMCIHIEAQEQEEIERKFKRAGDRFTDLAGEGGFLVGFKGLDIGDGDSKAIFAKVSLGDEILRILRGILEDGLTECTTDLWFTLHVMLFTENSLTPDKTMKLLKTTKSA